MKTNLQNIIKQSIKGNRKYQSLLYDMFSGMVNGVCRRYAASEEEANDMFQEAFLKVFQNLKKLKDPEALPGWVKRITVNTCLDMLKVEKSKWDIPLDQVQVDDQNYSEMLDKLNVEQLVEVVNELPEGYRIVLNMYVVDGYSHKEIAEHLGIGESTSRSQLTYAKKLLKQKLVKLGVNKYEPVV